MYIELFKINLQNILADNQRRLLFLHFPSQVPREFDVSHHIKLLNLTQTRYAIAHHVDHTVHENFGNFCLK